MSYRLELSIGVILLGLGCIALSLISINLELVTLLAVTLFLIGSSVILLAHDGKALEVKE